MKFIDEATITVQSGDGGRGCVSFRREKFVPRGGPDGGDGGKGGDVVLVTTLRKRTLQQFQFKRQFRAPNGGHGQGKQKTGRNGDDLIIELPPGTLVSDADTGTLLQDLTDAGERYVAARGGRGGLGNTRFKSSTNRAPRHSQPGEPGALLTLKLELKLLADVGLVGLPNAGKSTLIRALSAARPKVGEYPFTTLNPSLGVVATGWGEPFVVADIPGLIAGAHQGAGLGHRFLRHIERTRVLVHMIDIAAIDPGDPLAAFETVQKELALFKPELDRKPMLVALNKIDLPAAAANARRFSAEAPDLDILTLSARNAEGLDPLKSKIVQLLERADEDLETA
ncbi:MAG: GTPase ObgE [Desulfobacterales bacterium]|nr:GTPase ObgE [Desulfobacterales bacterium]MDJ0856191.1 GTPase ObgE [Desulfobacterales bacterium]MDJ0991598.1 GTPase ObgE [Desulfobacterales bacterium]